MEEVSFVVPVGSLSFSLHPISLWMEVNND